MDDNIDNVFQLAEYAGGKGDKVAEGAAKPEGREVTPAAQEKDIHVVQYEPGEKSERLGRPRNNTGIAADEEAAVDNLDNAMVSKFRFDGLPVDGPGSRGGTGEVKKEPRGVTTRKKKQASLMNFFKSEDDQLPEEVNSNNGLVDTDAVDLATQTPETGTSPSPAAAKPKKRKAPAKKIKKLLLVLKPLTSRTTVINNRHKITRQRPGPILPLYYDLYDENTILAADNAAAAEEKIALGFKAVPKPYIADLMYVMQFLNKFRDVIYLYNIGPQDIEEGLGLIQLEVGDLVLPLMELVFCQLLTLVLNRKKPVQTNSQGKAIAELKAQALTLGLPKEWRDDSNLLVPETSKITLEPVDPNQPEHVLDKVTYYQSPAILPNPFDRSSTFENQGLRGLEPLERIVVLRVLIQWLFIASNAVKEYVSASIQAQDLVGEKDTYYGPRAILRGFKNTEEVKKETETKIKKRKGSLDDPELRYVDPTSDPLAHTMRLRLDEFVCGDVGFHVGRFYFVRMADEKSGGLASIDQMSYAWLAQSTEISVPPSQFKLYVQDVHAMLEDLLTEYGVQFDERGNEVKQPPPANQPHWYEVAASVGELEAFANHIESRMTDVDPISASLLIHKPLLNLYNFLISILPLLKKQEESLRLGKGRTRKRGLNYNDVAASKKSRTDEDTHEHWEDEPYVEMEDADDDDDYADQ